MSTKNRIKMKEVNRYPDEFKKSVVKEVLSCQITQAEAMRRYGIRGKSLILNWIRKSNPMKQKMKSIDSKANERITRLEIENERLRKELDLERVRSLSLNVMIDFAEKEFNIPIRKKSGVKQLKK
jgi:transposase-like protein